jgi:hypothetical protein
MHNGTRTENNQRGGDYNMYEGYKKLTEDEFREFESWIHENNQELYDNKIAYEVRWTNDKDYYVKLLDENIYTISDVLLDIHQELV